jgi:hypothetical protein
MRTVLTIVLYAHLGFLAGCANSENLYGNIYEGLKTRDALVHPPVEQRPAEQSMSYQDYEAERKKLLETTDKK